MADPWDEAASAITSKRQRDAEAAAETARLAKIKRDKKTAEARAAQQEMEAAIAAAVPQLIKFLAERGPAAQRLLAANGERALVMFGCDQDGGSYSSVFLDGTGLRHEIGWAGGYSSEVISNQPTTPQKAVEMFALYGSGFESPEKVRNLVRWLIAQIESRVPKD